MAKIELHEELSREEEVHGSSDRAFGLTFAVIGSAVGLFKWWRGGFDNGRWWLAAALVFLVLALFWTAPLAPLNRAWLKLSLLMYKVMNPIIMALLFFLTVLPIGLIMRALGKDLLRLRGDPVAPTYWITRDPVDPARDSMKNQF